MGGHAVSMPTDYFGDMKKTALPSLASTSLAAGASRSSAARVKGARVASRSTDGAGMAATKAGSGGREVLRTGVQLERFHRIHSLLAEGHAWNVPELVAEFKNDGVKLDAKTIRRDLAFMRDRLGLPVSEYDAAKGGFYYTEAVHDLPLVQVTEGELLALMVGRQAVEAYRGTPYGRLMEQAFAKITAGLRDVVSFPVGGLADAISFRSTGTALVDEELFTAVSKAVLNRREVEFTYRKPDYNEPERRRLQPYHLASVGGMWYLAGHDLDRQEMRTFSLSRMSEFVLTRHRFARDPKFTPELYFRDSFGMLRGEETVTVRIEFDSYAGQLVRERFWHASQKFTDKSDGGIELELQVGHTDEVRRWVLGWGERARVIEPPSLVAEMREVTGRLAEAYRVAGGR